MAKKNTEGAGKAIAVGAGIAVLSTAAYLLFGPEGKKHRKDLQSWMIKMKAEVMEKMEKAKELSGETYEEIVNAVESKYKGMKNVDAELLAKEVAELKRNWKALAKEAKKKTGSAKKTK